MQALPRSLALLCLAASMLLVGSYVALTKPLALVFPVMLLAWLRFGSGGGVIGVASRVLLAGDLSLHRLHGGWI